MNITMALHKSPVLLTLIVTILGACLIQVIALGTNAKNTKRMHIAIFLLTLLILIDGLLHAIGPWSYNIYANRHLLQTDCITQFGSIFIFAITCITTLQMWDYRYQEDLVSPKTLIYLLLATVSNIGILATNNLLVLLLALTLMSLTTNILITIPNAHQETKNSKTTYLLFNSITTIISLIGLVIIYSKMASLNITNISYYLTQHNNVTYTSIFGLALFIFGLFIRISILPLRQLAPNIYNNIPHLLTTFITIGTNGSIVLALLRMLPITTRLFALWPPIRMILVVVIVISLVLSSLALLFKTINIKQTLIYFAIIHMNYLLLSLIAQTTNACIGTMFHLIACSIVFIGAFGILAAFELAGTQITFDSMNGLGWKHPLLGIAISVCMLSIAGLPLTAGFYSKCMIFKELVAQAYIPLICSGYLSSIVLFYRGLRLPITLFANQQLPHTNSETIEQYLSPSLLVTIIIANCGLISFIMGLMPTVMLNTTIIEMAKEMFLNLLS